MKHFLTVSWAAIIGAMTGLLSSLAFDIIADIISDELTPSEMPQIIKSLDELNLKLDKINETLKTNKN